MDPSVQRQQLRQQRERDRLALRHRAGTITATGPLSVALGGSDTAYDDVRTLAAGLQVNDVVSVITFGNDALILGRIIDDSGWTALTLDAAWANENTVTYNAAAYRKDSDGRVHLRGRVTKTTGLPVNSDTIGTLPAGFRPVKQHGFAVASGVVGGASQYGRIDALPTGVVRWIAGNSSTETDVIFLDGISFWID